MSCTYTGWVTAEVDENSHKHEYENENDAFGRLLYVREQSGTSPSWPLYATTTYAYDLLARLLTVTDANSNVTTIEYDKLGRKLSQADPDLGLSTHKWVHAYDWYCPQLAWI